MEYYVTTPGGDQPLHPIPLTHLKLLVICCRLIGKRPLCWPRSRSFILHAIPFLYSRWLSAKLLPSDRGLSWCSVRSLFRDTTGIHRPLRGARPPRSTRVDRDKYLTLNFYEADTQAELHMATWTCRASRTAVRSFFSTSKLSRALREDHQARAAESTARRADQIGFASLQAAAYQFSFPALAANRARCSTRSASSSRPRRPLEAGSGGEVLWCPERVERCARQPPRPLILDMVRPTAPSREPSAGVTTDAGAINDTEVTTSAASERITTRSSRYRRCTRPPEYAASRGTRAHSDMVFTQPSSQFEC